MARLIEALRRAPSLRPALAGSVLCLLLVASLPLSAYAKRTTTAPTAGAGTTAITTPAAPVQQSSAVSTAAPEARGHAQRSAPQPGPSGKESTTRPSHEASAVSKGERTQRHTIGRTPSVTEGGGEEADSPSSVTPATGVEGGARAQAVGPPRRREREREREREQRRKEREARKEEGTRETRKERLAREAEEARRRKAPETPVPVPVPVQVPVEQPALARVASAPAPATSVPVAAATIASPGRPESPLPVLVGESAVATSGAREAHRMTARRHAVSAGPVLGPSGLSVSTTASAAVVPAAVKRAVGHGRAASNRARPAAHSHSELVRTVTRIIGVIPATLWALIGGLGALALAFAVSSRLARRRAGQLARQRRDLLQDVGLLQAALLPELPQRIGPVGTTAAYRPASGPAAGGDFYDVFGLPDGQLAVIVGDVSGHGRKALPHTTLLRFTLRAYLEAGLSPRESLRTAAPVLERQLGGSFATVVLATYEPRERLLTYACAGHPHPIISGLENVQLTACSAPPVGTGQPTGTRQTVVAIPGEAVVGFYTDGVIEARVEGELFGTERLERALTSLGAAPSAGALLDRVGEQTDGRPDDMASCLLGVEGGAARPFVCLEEIELSAKELEHDRVRRLLSAAGVEQSEAETVLARAGDQVTREGRALLRIRRDSDRATATITNDNLASLSARAIARTQEIAL